MNNLNRWWKGLKDRIKILIQPKEKTLNSSDSNQQSESTDINKAQGKKTPWGYFVRKKRQPNFFISVFVATLRMFLILVLLIGFAGFGAIIGVGKAYLDTTPELDVVQIQDQNETTFIYDKFGKLITEYYGFENRVWAPIDEIPQTLKDAFVSIEDVRFDVHNGIDIKRIFGSAIHNLSNESVQGASTITQQLIKNTILTPEVSYKRKIQEMYLATQLEKRYSKDQIMEAYLNTIWLGGSNYGVKTAAKDYFGKDLADLTLRESAMLAGITRNPWRYDPRMNVYDRDTPEWSFDRTNLVLTKMYENGKIPKEEYDSAKIETSQYHSNPMSIVEDPVGNDYPMKYFIEYVIKDVRDRIMDLEGWEGEEGRKKADQYIYSGGLHIYTTLDPDIQQAVEEEVYNYKNLPKFRNSAHEINKHGVEQPQAAAVVIDNATGELRAIVGGKQPPTGKRQYNRAFHPDAKLPIGSSMKPLSVYGPFIEAGYPGGIIIENIPAPIKGWEKGKYPYPRNYGGGSFEGPTSVRRGIFKSLNVVAGRIVLERISPQYSADKLKELGLNPEDVTEEPAALALGTRGNNMIEVAGAYTTIANKGIYQEPISFTKILDKNGKEIINTQKERIRHEVFKESTTFILTDWMQDVINGGTATVRIKNDNGQSINAAGKTGTNSDFKGVYFAGFTPYYTSTVWLGHDDFQPQFVNNTTGGKFAAPLWQNIMNSIHGELENKNFYDQVPDGVVQVTVCGVSGKRPNGELCAKDIDGHGLVTEWFPKGAAPGPNDICDMHVKIDACPYSGKPPTPYCPKDEMSSAAAILIPKNSPYRSLSESELAKYLPGALKDLDKLGRLDYDNPNDRPFFCPLHTEEWYKGEKLRESMNVTVSELLAKVKANMNNPKYIPKLTKDRLSKLNKAIKKLEDALTSGGDKAPKKSEPKGKKDHKKIIDKLPIFDASLVEIAMEELANINNEIFSTIEKELEDEKDDEEPVQTPDPPNNGNEEPPSSNGEED